MHRLQIGSDDINGLDYTFMSVYPLFSSWAGIIMLAVWLACKLPAKWRTPLTYGGIGFMAFVAIITVSAGLVIMTMPTA